MDKTPSVSVIIPVFNGVRFLAEAVESIWNQRHPSLEVIVVDDGSIDGTWEKAQQLTGARVFRQSNRGPAAARNLGIRESCGELLGFLDADDCWAPEKLARQIGMLQSSPEVHLVAGRVNEFYSNSVPTNVTRERRRSGERAYTIGALLVRRADFCRVGFLDETLRLGEFMDWRSRAICAGLKEYILEDVVLHRRIHGGNTTLSTNDRSGYVAAIRAHLLRQLASKVIAPNKSEA